MKKYNVEYIVDAGDSTYTIYTIVESECNLDTTTLELVKMAPSTGFIIANRDPEYYESENPGQAAIRTSKIVEIIVKEHA